nr:hypothetical protein [Prevotella sp.]
MYSCTTNYNFSQCTGSYKKEGDMFNREHSFPRVGLAVRCRQCIRILYMLYHVMDM